LLNLPAGFRIGRGIAMFHDVPKRMLERMEHLESLDRRERAGDTARAERLRQIPAETGRFIAFLAAAAPEGLCLEIGTSGGFSTLWVALACREVARRVVTFEILEEKVSKARETFREAAVEDIVDLVHGDARDHLERYGGICFCFLDAAKDHYLACYEKLVDRMVSGGILAADNATSKKEELLPFLDRVLSDRRVDAMIVPVGEGVLVARKR